MALCIQQQIFWLEVSVNHLQVSALQTDAEVDEVYTLCVYIRQDIEA